ncbi:MAG: 50S ribosomal protein L15 [Elusimicrobiota bacterium]
MWLHKIKPAPGSRTPRRIVGRGEGSTLGQTAGKGQKGQSSRAGDSVMTGFEGGQTPLIRRIPKRGFNNPRRINYAGVDVKVLEVLFKSGDEINGQNLFQKGVLKNPHVPYKILGKSKITKSFKVNGGKLSQSAQKVIQDAGGSIAEK